MLPGVILQKPYLTSMLVLLWRGGWTRWHPRGLSNLHSFTVLYDTHKRKVRLCFPWRCNSRYDSPRNLKSYKRWQLQDLLQHVLSLSNPIIPGPVSIGRSTAKSMAGDGDPQNVVRGVISRQDSLISVQCAEIQPSGHNLLCLCPVMWPFVWERGWLSCSHGVQPSLCFFLRRDGRQGKPTWLRLSATEILLTDWGRPACWDSQQRRKQKTHVVSYAFGFFWTNLIPEACRKAELRRQTAPKVNAAWGLGWELDRRDTEPNCKSKILK